MIDKIKNYSEELIDVLRDVSRNGVKHYRTYDLDCNFFDKYSEDVIRDSNEHKIYEECLRPLKGPVLYWFEILSDTKPETIRSVISEYKLNNGKAVPALSTKFDKGSKTLYVGKVKSKFWSRVIQHIGIYKNRKTQGLQLYHWSKDLNLKLRIHAFEFDKGMSNMITVFEYKMAKELRPIIGKHQ